jgi:hypothetical protein
MKKAIAALTAGLLFAGHSQAGPWSGFYDQQTLKHQKESISPGILDNWQSVIFPALTQEERRSLEKVRFVVELEAPDFAMNFFAKDNVVYIPASATKMLGELVASWIWLNKNGYSTDTIYEYLAILKYQWESGLLRGQAYRPFDVLGVPASAREDPSIADEYDRIISNTLFFIICHELGHVLYGHQGFDSEKLNESASKRSIAQEQQADAFALEIMRRIGDVPIGVPLFFSLMASLESYSTDPDYGRLHTHPLSSERIHSIADGLRAQARSFARAFSNPATAIARVNEIADQLVNASNESAVAALESPVIQDLWRQKGLQGRLLDLKPRKMGYLNDRNEAADSQQRQPPFDGSYYGLWSNQQGSNFNVKMDLQRNNEKVTGSFTFGSNQAEIEGFVNNGHLYFDWRWGGDYFGKGELYQAANGRLSGTWGYTKESSGGGTWDLARF